MTSEIKEKPDSFLLSFNQLGRKLNRLNVVGLNKDNLAQEIKGVAMITRLETIKIVENPTEKEEILPSIGIINKKVLEIIGINNCELLEKSQSFKELKETGVIFIGRIIEVGMGYHVDEMSLEKIEKFDKEHILHTSGAISDQNAELVQEGKATPLLFS